MLALRDSDRANKNEIQIFVPSITSNDFPHEMLVTAFTDNRRKIRKPFGRLMLMLMSRVL